MGRLAIFIVGLSLFLLVLAPQQPKENDSLLANMRERAAAVRAFRGKEGRLPTESEYGSIAKSRPSKGIGGRSYNIHLFNDPERLGGTRFEEAWRASGGWVLAVWMGEWFEYYSSWDDRSTLEGKLSIWAFPYAWLGTLGLATSISYLVVRIRRAIQPVVAAERAS